LRLRRQHLIGPILIDQFNRRPAAPNDRFAPIMADQPNGCVDIIAGDVVLATAQALKYAMTSMYERSTAFREARCAPR